MKIKIQAANRRHWNQIQQNRIKQNPLEEKKDDDSQIDLRKKERSLDKS